MPTIPSEEDGTQARTPISDQVPAPLPLLDPDAIKANKGKFAFVSHLSACEALRHAKGSERRWPSAPRPLPLMGACVTNQGEFQRLSAEVDLAAYGIVSRPVDLLVPSSYARSKGRGARFHVWSRTLPSGSFLRMGERLLVSSPELVVVQLLSSQAKFEPLFEDFIQGVMSERRALDQIGVHEPPVAEMPTRWESIRRLVATAAIACEFSGTYRLRTQGGSVLYQAPRLMSTASLPHMIDAANASFVAKRIRTVAAIAFDSSASPMETALALLLTMPLDLGGIGLPKPQLNRAVDVSALRGALSDRDHVTPDMVWEGEHVALEYDSSEFHALKGARQLGQDAIRANILSAMGYSVFRVTPEMVGTLSGLEMLARQLAARLGVTLEQPNDIQALRRRKIYAELMGR